MKRKATPEERIAKARGRMLEKSREYQIGTYANKFVAREFQRMIRAEAAAQPSGYTAAVYAGRVNEVYRRRGQCACVTCGSVRPWSSHSGQMQTGHFLASRCFAILFEEDNVAPQCTSCNGYHGGMPEQYQAWMIAVRGQETVDRLRALKSGPIRKFTRDELVDLRISYKSRLKEAERILTEGAK